MISALLPVFLVIVLGAGLRRFRLLDDNHWRAIDEVAYRVLFPALIFKEIASANFSGVPVLGMAGAMMLAVVLMSAGLLAFRTQAYARLAVEGPAYASLFQGATRWHTFITLAIVPSLVGSKGLALGAVGAATMTPLLNIINAWVHARYASPARLDGAALLRSLVSNPFVYSSLLGVAWQVAGLPLPWPAFDVLDIVGKAALGLALLGVGAGLRLESIRSQRSAVLVASGLRLLVMPLLMFACIKAFGVSGDAALVAMLCGAVPTGSGSYVLARQMGGDAPLMATILTVQVALSALTLPLVFWLFTAVSTG